MCGVLVQEAAQLKAQSCREGSGSGTLRPNIPQYRGSSQLLFLQCSNTYSWMKTPPVLFDFKKTSWTSLTGPGSECQSREGSAFVFHEKSIYSFGDKYSLERSPLTTRWRSW